MTLIRCDECHWFDRFNRMSICLYELTGGNEPHCTRAEFRCHHHSLVEPINGHFVRVNRETGELIAEKVKK